MNTKSRKQGTNSAAPSVTKCSCEDTLHKLQIKLVKLQRHFIKCNDKILIIFEGRGATGKNGTTKRIVRHPSPRETRIVVLEKSTDRDGQGDAVAVAVGPLAPAHRPGTRDEQHPGSEQELLARYGIFRSAIVQKIALPSAAS